MIDPVLLVPLEIVGVLRASVVAAVQHPMNAVVA